jgi:ferrous iron transport protein A
MPEHNGLIPLSEMPAGAAGILRELRVEGFERRRMLDLGFVPGTRVEAVRWSPLGDPRSYRLRGTIIALRTHQAQQVLVECEGGG